MKKTLLHKTLARLSPSSIERWTALRSEYASAFKVKDCMGMQQSERLALDRLPRKFYKKPNRQRSMLFHTHPLTTMSSVPKNCNWLINFYQSSKSRDTGDTVEDMRSFTHWNLSYLAFYIGSHFSPSMLHPRPSRGLFLFTNSLIVNSHDSWLSITKRV